MLDQSGKDKTVGIKTIRPMVIVQTDMLDQSEKGRTVGEQICSPYRGLLSLNASWYI